MTRGPLLIAGAGYVGQALADRVQREGFYEPLLLRRNPNPISPFPQIKADLLRLETLSELPAVDDVVYCASADASTEDAYRQIYQQGLKHLLQALNSRGGFRRLIYISSTSVYDEQEGGWVDETSRDLVHKGPSRFMVGGERDLIAGTHDYTILRMGGIYGPDRTSFLKRVQSGQERIYTRGGLYTNRIHRDDAVGMILHALLSAPERQIYNGVDCEATDRNEVIRWLAKALGQNPDELPKTDDKTLIPHRGNKRIRNDKILEAGYRFVFPSFREGYQDLIAHVK